MTKVSFVPPPEVNIPREIQELLAPPPLLSTEDPIQYWRTLSAMAKSLKPRNAIEWILVQTATDEWWETQRARTFKVRVIEEARKRDVQERRDGIEHAHSLRLSSIQNAGSSLAAFFGAPPQTEKKELSEDEKKKKQEEVTRLQAETAEQLRILERAPTNADFAAGIARWIVAYERLEQLQVGAQKRFIAARQELEAYRELASSTLLDDNIGQGEFEEATLLPPKAQEAPHPPRASAVDPAALMPTSKARSENLSAMQFENWETGAPSVEIQSPSLLALPPGTPSSPDKRSG